MQLDPSGQNVEEYKEKLFQSFKNTGVLDHLKTQLRHKTLEKLIQSQKHNYTLPSNSDSQKQLRKRIIASIISEYLEQENLNYSQSIFLPESGFSQKTLLRQELSDMINIQEINQKESILDNIIQTYMKNVQKVPRNNSSTQTEHADAVFNLEQRLNYVDNQFREKVKEATTPTVEIEERLQKYKRDFEIRMKAEMNAELQRIREFEISSLRMEEQEKCRKQMQEYREDLERNYMDKLAKLRDREKEVFDKCAYKMREIENINHEHRQKILKDFELIRLREEQIDKQKALNEEAEKLGKAKISNLEKELKEKIKKYEESSLLVEKKYNNDIAYTKLEAHRELEIEKMELLEKKKQLDEDMYKIKQMKDTVQQFTEQNKKLAEDNRKLTDDLHETKRKKKEFELELTQLRENMRNVSDSYRRDQDAIKSFEQKQKIKEEEINFYKNALEEQKKLVEHHKMNQIDQLKNYNNDIQQYQNRIEELENKLKEYKKIEQQTFELISQTNKFAQLPQQQQQLQYNNENKNNSNFNNFIIQRELEELKNQRNKQIQLFQKENDYLEKKQYNKLFDLPSTNNLYTKSVYIDKTQNNLIEESFREEMDYTKYEQKLLQQKEQEKNAAEPLTNSRLRVFTEIEKSRIRKNTEDFVIKKTQSPTRVVTEKKDLAQDLEKNKSNFYKQNQIDKDPLNTENSQDEQNMKGSNVFSNKNLIEIPAVYSAKKVPSPPLQKISIEYEEIDEESLEAKPQKKEDPFAKKVDPFKKPEPLLKKQESLGTKLEPFAKKEDPFAKKDDIFGKKDESLKKIQDPISKKDDIFGKKDDIFVKKDDIFGKKDDPFSKKDDIFGKKDDIFGKKDDPFAKKDNTFGKKDDGFYGKKFDPLGQVDPLGKKDNNQNKKFEQKEEKPKKYDFFDEDDDLFGKKEDKKKINEKPKEEKKPGFNPYDFELSDDFDDLKEEKKQNNNNNNKSDDIYGNNRIFGATTKKDDSKNNNLNPLQKKPQEHTYNQQKVNSDKISNEKSYQDDFQEEIGEDFEAIDEDLI